MAITTQERSNVIKLTVAMFNAAPGATYLAQFSSFYEAGGRSLSTLAAGMANTSIYATLNPSTQTGGAFASAFLTPFGLQASAEALNFISTRFNAGMSKGQIAYEAAVALNDSSAPVFADAKAILNNKTSTAETYSVTQGNTSTSISALQQAVANVTQDPATVTSSNTANASSNSVIDLTLANDTYTIGAGNFTINGLGGDDTITTGHGNNTINTPAGNDTITTGDGNDTINAGDGNNTVNAGGGTNTVTTGTGNDTITTGAGNDVIVSGTGNDIINSGAGTDIITSGAGNDSIALGVDSVLDTVIFGSTAATNGSDVISNFTSGIDKLNLDAMTAQTATTAVTGALTVTAGNVYFLASSVAGNADSVAAAAAVLQAAATWTNGTNGTVAFFVVNDDNSSAVYQYVEAGTTGISLTELTLIATVDAKIVVGDLLFA
ncbi:calcium-binding protein [Polaromonas sp.]|uniref:calcium-binding protein n=1 Tax=Polaromonas sp. TaxID=1869339 RepID=UPI0035648536